MLLKRFGDGVGRDAYVFVTDAQTGTSRRQRVRNVAREKDLYALDNELLEHVSGDGVPSKYQGRDGFETFLGDIEHLVGPTLDHIESSRGLPTDFDERAVLRMFLARLLCLNQRYMRHLYGLSGTPVSFDSARVRVIGVALHHYEAFVAFLDHCALKLYDFREVGPVLACGDLPLFSVPPRDGVEGGSARIMLPLTSDLLLIAEEASCDEVHHADMELAGYANAHALFLAQREVYSRQPGFPVMLLSSSTESLTIEEVLAGQGPDVVAGEGLREVLHGRAAP